MRKIIFILLALLLYCSLATAKTITIEKYPLTPRDRGVLIHVFDQIRLVDNFKVNGPSFVQPGFDTYVMTFQDQGKTEWKIDSVTFDGKEVISETEIKASRKMWLWGERKIELKYKAGPMMEGVHALVIKGKKGLLTEAMVILNVGWAGKNKKGDDEFVASKGLSRIFKNLERAQNRIQNFSAKFENTVNYKRKEEQYFGRYEVFGAKMVHLTFADPAKVNMTKPALRDRNKITQYGLLFYLDYADLWENYKWIIASEDEEQIGLYGWHGWLSNRPCIWMMTVDKNHWVPTSVNTFMAGKTVLSQAYAKYTEVDNNWVPLSQSNRIKRIGDDSVYHTIEFSDFRINNLKMPTKGSI